MRTMFFRVMAVMMLVGMGAGRVEGAFTFDHVGGGATGSITPHAEAGSYTFEGGGEDIWSASDSFDFAHSSLSGNFDVRVRVQSLEPTARWTKAGIMARETLAGNSRMAFPRVTPAQVGTPSGGDGAGDSCYAYRTGVTTPQQGEHEDGCASNPNFYPNNWVRLVRNGSQFLGYRSTDGLNWTLMGNQDSAGWEGGAMPGVVEVGLAVSRHSGPEALATAEFRDYANIADDPTAVSRQPASVTVLEGQTATFSVDVAGGYDGVTFQWQEDGADIGGATGRSYTTSAGTVADSGKEYRVRVTRGVSVAVSDAAVWTVTSAPVLESVSSRGSDNQVYLVFSEPVSEATALDLSNYDVVGLNVDSVAFGENTSTVVLTVSPNLTVHTVYTVNIFNVEDREVPPNPIAPNPTTATFKHPEAGAFFSDFNSGTPAGMQFFGGAAVEGDGGVGNSGALKVTKNINSLNAAVVLDDFNGGAPVEQFVASFDIRIGGGTCCGERTADGMSFNFGDLPNGVYPAGEDGAGNGLRITFDTWDNAGADTAPAIDLVMNNQIIASQSMAGIREGGRAPAGPLITDPATGQPMTLTTGDGFAHVVVELDPDGTVDVSYKGVLIFNNVQTGYTPRTGRFGFGARTGGANDNHFVDNLDIRLFSQLGPVQIVTQPQSQSVNENASVSFRVSADGTPPIEYQWQVNGMDIPGATGPLFTTVATVDKNGNVYRAVAQNDFSSATSDGAVLTVIADTTAPTVVSAAGDLSFVKVVVNFSEPVDSGSGLDPFSYTIADQDGNDLPVMSAAYGANQSQVILTTAPQAEATTYTVTVNDVADQSAGANTVAPNSQVSFTTRELSLGVVAREYYYNNTAVTPPQTDGTDPDGQLGGVAIADLRNHPGYPNSPKFVCFNTIWELNTFDQMENYGARLAALFIPKVSGPHVFYISADDNAELWMSTDADPANSVLIAREPVWNGRRDWVGTARRNAGAPENRSAPINLIAGQRYYLESLVKEGGGGDNLAVAVQQPGQPVPANGSTPITGDLFGDFVENPGGVVTITQQPADQSVEEFHAVTFTVAATSSSPNCGGNSLSYQWQRNGVDIPGATGTSYTTPVLMLGDNGTEYRAVARIPGVRANSRSAVVTVTEDTTPPTVVSVSSVGGGYIGICFNETVQAVDANNPLNYQVNGGLVPVVTAQLRPDGQSVVLGLVGSVSGNFTVRINNVRDAKGLAIAPNTTASGQVWAAGTDVIGPYTPPNRTSPPGTNFSCATGDVDVVAGGNDIWGTSDEFHFVYQRKAGNFDVKVKLQRLDPANNWAKAGLMARESLNGNSATIEAYSTPNLPPGTATYEAGRRPTTGVDTIEWGSRPATDIPNAWIRLKRVENTFRAFRGTDGVNWSLLAGPVDQPMTGLLYVGMATTSHNTGQSTVAEYRSFMDVAFPDAQITIVRAPMSMTVDENNPAVFTVEAEVTGAPASELEYQWQESTDGVSFVNIPGAHSPTFSINQVTMADDGRIFRVIVSVPGVAVISPSSGGAVLTVVPDVNPPFLQSAQGNRTFDQITVVYNEQVDPGLATDAFSYTVLDPDGNELPVASVTGLPDGRSVVLQLMDGVYLEPDTIYTVRVNDVTDISGNTIAPNSEIDFRSFVISCGFALQELWHNIGGVLIADLTNNPAYPNNPSSTSYITLLEGPRDQFDNYGVRLSGYIIPPISGNYNFWMSADDQGAFYLSTDETPANLQVVAAEPVWNGIRDYNGTARRNAGAPENRSSTLFPGGIPLVAGQRYYFQALMKEGGGGDNLSVAWQLPGGTPPGNGSSPIPGQYLAVAANPVGASINITQQPQDVFIVPSGSGGTPLLNENFNAGNGGFTVANAGTGLEHPWTYGAAAGVGGNGAWFVNGTANSGSPTSSRLTSPTVTVNTAGPVTLSFDHRFNFEYDGTRWDGGQVRISVNGSPFVAVPQASFTSNPHTGTITGNNELNGQMAFNGESGGYGVPVYIRSTAVGNFAAGTTLTVQFLGAWDEFTKGAEPNWVVDNVVIREGAGSTGDQASFTVAATGVIPGNANHPIFIQWERSNDNGATWTPIPGANGATYTKVGIDPSDEGALFRAQLYVPGATVASAAGRLTIAVNNAPSFTGAGNQTVAEDSGPQSVNWASNISPGPASYEAGQVVSFEVSNNNPGLFSVQPSIDGNGVLTYTPAPNSSGSATVTVVARDDGGTAFGGQDSSAPQTFTITVTPGNDCPVANNQSVTLDEDTTASIVLTGSDPEGDALTYVITSGPAHGTLSGTPPNVTYHPAAEYCGADQFTFSVSDGSPGCAGSQGLVQIQVNCVNDCPDASIAVVPPVIVRPGGTNYAVISPNNCNAEVLFEGSRSADPEGEALNYAWYEIPPPAGSQVPVPPGSTDGHKNTKGNGHTTHGNGNGHGHDGDHDGENDCQIPPPVTGPVQFGDMMVAGRTLWLGQHNIQLIVTDGCTSTDTVLVEVITAAEAVEDCIDLVNNSSLSRKDKRALIDTLKKAATEFNKGNFENGLEKLDAFIKKARDRKLNQTTTAPLIACAQQIIDALDN